MFKNKYMKNVIDVISSTVGMGLLNIINIDINCAIINFILFHMLYSTHRSYIDLVIF